MYVNGMALMYITFQRIQGIQGLDLIFFANPENIFVNHPQKIQEFLQCVKT